MKLSLKLTQVSLVSWLIAILLAILSGVGSYIVAPKLHLELFTEYPWALTLTSIVFAIGGFGIGLGLSPKETSGEEKGEET